MLFTEQVFADLHSFTKLHSTSSRRDIWSSWWHNSDASSAGP